MKEIRYKARMKGKGGKKEKKSGEKGEKVKKERASKKECIS